MLPIVPLYVDIARHYANVTLQSALVARTGIEPVTSEILRAIHLLDLLTLGAFIANL
jgi:hypothetical protein